MPIDHQPLFIHQRDNTMGANLLPEKPHGHICTSSLSDDVARSPLDDRVCGLRMLCVSVSREWIPSYMMSCVLFGCVIQLDPLWFP